MAREHKNHSHLIWQKGKHEIWKKVQANDKGELKSIAYIQIEEGCYRQVTWDHSSESDIEEDCEKQACIKLHEEIAYHFYCKRTPIIEGDTKKVYVLHEGKWQYRTEFDINYDAKK